MIASLLGVLFAAAVLVWPSRAPIGPGSPPNPGSAGRLPRRRPGLLPGRRRRALCDARHGILTMLESIGPAVSAGVVPAVAVAAAADLLVAGLPPGLLARDLGRLAAVARRGDELAEEWDRLARRHRIEGVRVVARAWSLCEELGCGLAESVETAAAVMRAEEEQQRRIRVATAGPRATMQLLTLLPVAGIGLCALMGVDPVRLYAGGVLVFSVLPGVALLLGGRAMVRRMMRRACRPEVLT